MKVKNRKANLLLLNLLLIPALVISFITSCDSDKEELGPLYGYANTEFASAQKITFELKPQEPVEKKFNFVLRRKADDSIQISYKYDPSLVDYVNAKNKKEYEVFPDTLFSLSHDIVTVLSGELQSDSITIKVEFGEYLDLTKEYLIPLKATVKQGNLEIPEKDSYLAFIVKPLKKTPDKSTGIKLFSCMEVNNHNPLNHLSFKTKKEDKYLFDGVIIFSVNVLYNSSKKKVTLALNPKNKYLFDNVEKYVRPLQDAGIKVLFSILPHHTAAGLGNLTDKACMDFAAELKRFNDYYGLDGVFFDDEYGYKGWGDPSILNSYPTKEAASRLVYETKKAMPENLVTIYIYGQVSELVAVNGEEPGEFVDFVFPNYGEITDYSDAFKGISKARHGMYSYNFDWGWDGDTLEQYLRTYVREPGYGANMIYGLNVVDFRSNRHLGALEGLTKGLFDDELVFDGEVYNSEWSYLDGDPEEWIGE